MGIKERREKAKENLRQEIFDAASELFAKEGVANVSMRKIAEKIDYSPTTIYLYFKDKTTLLHQICEETFAKLAAEVEKIKDTSDDPLEILRGGMRAYIEFGLKHPNHYEVVFIAPLDSYIEKTPGFEYTFEDSMGKVAFEKLVESVVACVEAGVIKNGDIELISQTLWAGMHGLTSLLIGHTEFPFVEKERLIENLIETLIKGLKA
jgi:AcrR family transcriptional regulator